MNQLGDRNYVLIERGAKMFGTLEPDRILPAFEESLYIDEAEEVVAFLQWCHNNGRTIGHGNYEQVFADFKKEQADDHD